MTEEVRVKPMSRKAFSKEEKAALVLLIVAGMGGLFFGFRYMGKNLQSPFSFSYSGPEYLTASEEEQMQMEELRGRDTDGDTLNDYDERFIYKTSAYLSDSDSDGVNDASEVSAGGDPNCPTGKTCGGVASADTAADASDSILGGLTEPVAPDLDAAQAELDAAQNGTSTADQQSIIDNMTPAQLRELLIANGASEAQVNALSDTQLMQLYVEVLAEAEASSSP